MIDDRDFHKIREKDTKEVKRLLCPSLSQVVKTIVTSQPLDSVSFSLRTTDNCIRQKDNISANLKTLEKEKNSEQGTRDWYLFWSDLIDSIVLDEELECLESVGYPCMLAGSAEQMVFFFMQFLEKNGYAHARTSTTRLRNPGSANVMD